VLPPELLDPLPEEDVVRLPAVPEEDWFAPVEPDAVTFGGSPPHSSKRTSENTAQSFGWHILPSII
jgi:hypothetical protein